MNTGTPRLLHSRKISGEIKSRMIFTGFHSMLLITTCFNVISVTFLINFVKGETDMLVAKNINGIEILIDVFTMDELKAHPTLTKEQKKNAAEMVFVSAGFYSIVLKAENVPLINQKLNCSLDTSKDHKIIAAWKDMVDELGEEYAAAIIDHEVGHMVNGDTEITPTTDNSITTDGGGKFLNDVKYELLADMYSASIHGKAVMHGALSALPQAMRTVLHRMGNEAVSIYAEEFFVKLTSDKAYQERLQALVD